jgi:hypothetical protein
VPLPPRVAETLLGFGLSAEAMACVDDWHHHLGPVAVEALTELVESRGIAPRDLRPGDLETLRALAGARYLRENHPRWLQGESTPGFWRDRSRGGVASGLVVPLGNLEKSGEPLVRRLAEAARLAIGEGQPPPRGLLLVSQNAHRGNQDGTIAFDVVPTGIDEALTLNAAAGRQHTVPGSIGETSGRTTGEPAIALLWETQPNVYKPSAARNRAAREAYRRHRGWPLVTAVAALGWLRAHDYRVLVLRGAGLRAAHEVNPAEPLGPQIEELHDRTFERAARALGWRLVDLAPGEAVPELTTLAKVNLAAAVSDLGAGSLVRELRD